jgi:selenocysteine-specific elongation factor
MLPGDAVKHLIMGTAGHIDHGKTALVKALTGVDCDTHKEEKRRGITINLGFAHLALLNGDTVGIIDVPGHFVHTMVAGAHGIDFVLMVVAADSGVMPQTKEHLQICRALGIKSGIVAVNKADLVDNAALTAVRGHIEQCTKNTFLDGCAMVNVSAVTGLGIGELKSAIAAAAAAAIQRSSSGVFRMYIDRVFSVSGFGTVVTGSVTGGTLRAGATAWLLPVDRELRVRRVERYGAEVPEVTAGDRASLNLVGLSKEEFVRGMMVADRPLKSSKLLDVTIRLFEGARSLSVWSQATLIMGTFEAQVRIHLLEKNSLSGGETGLAQLHIPQPCVAQAHDAFVLRGSASDVTIGGGEVIDPHPLHHRRRPQELVEQLKGLAGGTLARLIAIEAAKHPEGTDHISVAQVLNVSPEEVFTAMVPHPPAGIVCFSSEGALHLIGEGRRDAIVEIVKKNLADFHKANPFSEQGRTAEELQGICGLGAGDDARRFAGLFLDSLVQQGTLKRAGATFSLSGHSVALSRQDRGQCVAIEEFMKKSGMQTPLVSDLVVFTGRLGIDDRRLKQLLRYMVTAGVLYAVEGQYLHASIVDKCRALLVNALANTPQGLTVAGFRDLVSGNRKICLLLYSLFDGEGVTERKGDVRVLKKR